MKENVVIVVQREGGVINFQTPTTYSLNELETMTIQQLIGKISPSDRTALGRISDVDVMLSVGGGAKQSILSDDDIGKKASDSFGGKVQHKWFLRTAAALTDAKGAKGAKPPLPAKGHAAGGGKGAFLLSPLVRLLPLYLLSL